MGDPLTPFGAKAYNVESSEKARKAGVVISLLFKIADAANGSRGPALSHHEFDIETKGTFPLAPLGERGDRRAGGAGVFTKMEFVRESRKSKVKGKSEIASASPAFH